MNTNESEMQNAVEHAQANGLHLIEFEVGGRKKLLLTTKSGFRLRGFEISETSGIADVIKFIDNRREMLKAQRRFVSQKTKE